MHAEPVPEGDGSQREFTDHEDPRHRDEDEVTRAARPRPVDNSSPTCLEREPPGSRSPRRQRMSPASGMGPP